MTCLNYLVSAVIAALKHNDRVCEILVDDLTDYSWGIVMDLSAPNLLCLTLDDIPPSGYISSAAMIDCLSPLAKLEELRIAFRYSHSEQETRRPPPPTRFVLPVLGSFTFQGGSEYLADIFASIDTPLLQYSNITFLDLVIFRMSQTSSFIGYTSTKPIEGLHRAHLLFNDDFVEITLSSRKMSLVFSVKYAGIDSFWQFQSLTRVYYRLSPAVANRERFDVGRFGDRRHSPLWAGQMSSACWLEFLRPFAMVKRMYLSDGVALCLAPTLKGLARGSNVTGAAVLPALQNLFVEEFPQPCPAHEAIEEFVAARRLSGHPVDVQCWEKQRVDFSGC
jgi:hypothetical protein